MITKKQKQVIVEVLKEKFQNASSIFLVNFNKMTVDEAITLRRAFREKGVDFMVAKNTLIKRALQETDKFEVPDEILKLQTAIAFGYEDSVAPGKIIKNIYDKIDKPKFKGAIIEGLFFGEKDLNKVASLPSREDMIAAIVGSLNAPASGIVGSISAVIRDLASVIEEVAKKQNAA